jgi:hypothetical protein
MLKHWQRLIFGVFVLMIFEGALRKWVFPWAQAQVYLAKDVLLLFAYLGFVLSGRRGQSGLRGTDSIRAILLLAFVFGCLEVLNPYSPSIFVGLLGVKDYFLYAPLAFILPYAFTSREQFFRLIRLYLLLAIPVAVLGFVQVAAGPTSFINTYVSYDEDVPTAISTFGRQFNIVRTAGTFSYISGYSTYLSFISFLTLGYIMGRGWRIKNNVGPLFVLILVIGAMFTTGSRAPVYILVIVGPFMLAWALRARILTPGIAVRLCILLPIILFAALKTSPEAVDAFQYRAATSGDVPFRVLSKPVMELSQAVSGVPVFGLGIGVTHSAALTIMGAKTAWWLGGIIEEEEIARIAEELGIVGVFLLYLARFLIVALAVRCTSSFKDPAYRALGIVLTFNLALGVTGSIVTNPTAGLYYWGSLGLVLAMARLERLAYAKARTPVVVSRMEPWPSAAHTG